MFTHVEIQSTKILPNLAEKREHDSFPKIQYIGGKQIEEELKIIGIINILSTQITNRNLILFQYKHKFLR